MRSATALRARRRAGSAIPVARMTPVDQIGIRDRARQEVHHEWADRGDRTPAAADLLEHSSHHGARHALMLLARLDLGVLQAVPVGSQVGVLEPADEVAPAPELEAPLIGVVDQLLGHGRLSCLTHPLTPATSGRRRGRHAMGLFGPSMALTKLSFSLAVP